MYMMCGTMHLGLMWDKKQGRMVHDRSKCPILSAWSRRSPERLEALRDVSIDATAVSGIPASVSQSIPVLAITISHSEDDQSNNKNAHIIHEPVIVIPYYDTLSENRSALHWYNEIHLYVLYRIQDL